MKYPLIVLLLVTVLLIAGCTNENKNVAITPAVTNQPSVPVATTTQPALTTFFPTLSPTVPVTQVQTTVTLCGNSNGNGTCPPVNVTTIGTLNEPLANVESKPYINNLQFRKNYFYTPINNCPMEEMFPSIAKDPKYGLNQPVPKITAISAGEFNTMIRDFTEGKNENTKVIGIARCQGATVTPYWNFVQINAQLIPTNPRPSNYTIFLSIRSKGKIVTQINTTEMLVKDQMVTLTSYIPLKMDEMDIFDAVEIGFNKLPN